LYPPQQQIHWYLPKYIYQNKSTLTPVVLQKRIINQDFTLQIDKKSMDSNDLRLNYQTQPSSVGQKQDTVLVNFSIPQLHDTIQQQITKIISYEVIP
jgi:hypothetical protein